MKKNSSAVDSEVRTAKARRLCWLVLICQTLPVTHSLRRQKEPQFLDLLARCHLATT